MSFVQLTSFGAMARHLARDATRFYDRLQYVLTVAVRDLDRTARKEYGVYQPSVDQFPAWAELADATKADRVRQGFTENDPLLRSGALRDASKWEVHGLDGVAGNTDKRAFWHEFGTVNMPARPVYGPALARRMNFIASVLGDAIIARDVHFNFGLLADGRAHLDVNEDYEQTTELRI